MNLGSPIAPARSPVPLVLPASAPQAIQAQWNEGLELARCAAIFLVLWAHGGSLLPVSLRELLIPDVLRPGWWGVRIFFAISGYLIARQVLQVMESGRWRGVTAFFVRRWLRTVPTYWIVLALAALLFPGAWASSVLLRNALFLQSLGSLEPAVLEVGWSLVVEEWSYLAMGLLAGLGVAVWRLGLVRQRWLRSLAWWTVGVVIVAATAARWRYVSDGGVGWEPLKKLTALQFDSLAYGAGLALLAATAPSFFQWITQRSRWIWPLTLVAMGAFGLCLHDGPAAQLLDPVSGWQMLALAGYPIAGVLSACFLLGLWSFSFARVPDLLASAIRLLARVSYSTYLLHLPIRNGLMLFGPGLDTFCVYLILAIVVGWGGWYLLERPFIALRARWR